MQLIKNNPFRIIGLLAGATAKEQTRQIKRLIQFVEAQQKLEEDFSFPALGKIDRSVDNINEAASRLNLDYDKINAALFWFYKGNSVVDEPAFELLREGNLQETIVLWSKVSSTMLITDRNSSAFHNLATLILNNAFNSSTINEDLLEQGITLKLKYLNSDFCSVLIDLTTDETYRTTKKALQLQFFKQLYSEIEKYGSSSLHMYLKTLRNQEFEAKADTLNCYAQKIIEDVEKRIDETKRNSKENKDKAGKYGNELYSLTRDNMDIIKSIIDISDIKYISISDKLANEIFQCSITLFNYYYETEIDVTDTVLDLSKKAKDIAIGKIVLDRINDNILIVENHLKERPVKEKYKMVSEDVKFITDKLDVFQNLNNSISNALTLITECKPYLDNILQKLGINDILYVNLNTAILNNAQGMVVATVNESMERRNKYVKWINYKNMLSSPYYRTPRLGNLDEEWFRTGKFKDPNEAPYASEYSLESLKKVIREAWDVTIILRSFSMNDKERIHFNKNKNSLKKLYNQIDSDIIFFGDKPYDKYLLAAAWIGGIIFIVVLVIILINKL